MSVRIMMWNIQNFSITKRTTGRYIGRGMDRRQHPDYGTHQRWDHILNTIQRVNPDIFVLIEVGSGGANPGQIVQGIAAQGVLRLLQDLQNIAANNFQDFRVVPPIVSGTGGSREGIAVFFKMTNLVFTGPWLWGIDDNLKEIAVPPNARHYHAHAYDNPWANALPAGNNQRQRAAQWLFANALSTFPPRSTTTIHFPSSNNRSLCLMTFLDSTSNRNISLYSIHSPAFAITAGTVLHNLMRIRELCRTPINREVQVIVGDFNVNVLDPLQLRYYQLLQRTYYYDQQSHRRNRRPFVVHNTDVPTLLKGIVPRNLFGHVSYRNTARIKAGTNEAAFVAPYYGYVGEGLFGGGLMQGLDYILTRYGNNAGGPAANFRLVNRVDQGGGSPYPPDLGGETIQDMLDDYVQANRHFRTYARYGKIGAGRGASDHMALVIDV